MIYPNPEDKIKAYEQLCISYRAIDNFRAKLLGFLPLTTGGGLVFIVNKFSNPQNIDWITKSLLEMIGVFGILITLGLFSYEIYGIRKCAALINAGKELELLLHIKNGQFTKRPQNVLTIINETFAAGMIYSTVLGTWACFLCIFKYPTMKYISFIVVFLVSFILTLSYEYRLRKNSYRSR